MVPNELLLSFKYWSYIRGDVLEVSVRFRPVVGQALLVGWIS